MAGGLAGPPAVGRAGRPHLSSEVGVSPYGVSDTPTSLNRPPAGILLARSRVPASSAPASWAPTPTRLGGPDGRPGSCRPARARRDSREQSPWHRGTHVDIAAGPFRTAPRVPPRRRRPLPVLLRGPHNLHVIHAAHIGRTPWGWRDGVVREMASGWLHIDYVAEPGDVQVWHHDVARRLRPGTPVRLHEQYHALGNQAGWLNVMVDTSRCFRDAEADREFRLTPAAMRSVPPPPADRTATPGAGGGRALEPGRRRVGDGVAQPVRGRSGRARGARGCQDPHRTARPPGMPPVGAATPSRSTPTSQRSARTPSAQP